MHHADKEARGGDKGISLSSIGGIPEREEILNFSGSHDIVSDVEVADLQETNAAYGKERASGVRHRLVICMMTL
jgi:uncharacterized zinc-type alcohol dehydrogenase-like protein